MLQTLVVALGALALGVKAQETTTAPTSTTTGPKTHTISVGYGGFKFFPKETEAAKGDVVAFKFYPPDHSVIKADFFHGCIPYELTGEGKVGFFSGVKYLSGISEDPPIYTITINDTEPIFYYCGAKGSCKDQKMVGAINPNATWTLAEHLKRVEEAEFELRPGDDWPSEAKSTAPSGGHSPTATPNADQKTEPSQASSSGHGHLSPGAIAGIAIGSAAVLMLGGALLYLCGRRGGFDKAYRKSNPPYPSPMLPVTEPKYNMSPKSPGADAWASTSATPASLGATTGDQGREHPSPPVGYGPRSPPLSPNSGGYGTYAGTMVTNPDGTVAYYDPRSTPHGTPPAGPLPQQPDRNAVELPTSEDPGNSPLPNYQPSRQFSWAGGAESNYRPGQKS